MKRVRGVPQLRQLQLADMPQTVHGTIVWHLLEGSLNVNLGSFSRAAREPSVCLETSIVSAGDLDFSEDLSFWLYMYTFRPDYLMLRGKHTDKPAVTELLNKHRQAMVPLACNLLSLRGVSTYWKRISDRLSLEAWRVYGDPTLKIYRHLFPRPHDLPPLGVVDEFTQYAFMQDLPGCSDVSDHAYLALAAILSYHFSPAASMIVDFVAHEKAIGSKFQRILKSLGQRKKTVFKVPDTRYTIWGEPDISEYFAADLKTLQVFPLFDCLEWSPATNKYKFNDASPNLRIIQVLVKQRPPRVSRTRKITLQDAAKTWYGERLGRPRFLHRMKKIELMTRGHQKETIVDDYYRY